MLMPGRQFGQGENFPGVLVNGTTTVNGYTIPIDLSITGRVTGDAAEYVASNSVEFSGEFESSVSDEFTSYIVDGTYAGTGNQVSGGGAYGTAGRYRYGFGGQEMTNEIKGVGNSYTAEFWEYDPRLGRRWNLDPRPVTGISEYSVFGNNPIRFNDPQGDTLSNPQLLDALKIASDEIRDALKSKRGFYTAGTNSRLMGAAQKYAEKNNLNLGDFAEFTQAIDGYHNGLGTIAMVSQSAYERLDRSVINAPNLNSKQALSVSVGLMKESERDLTARMQLSLGAASFVATAGLFPEVGPGPKAPFKTTGKFELPQIPLKYDPRVRARGVEDPTSHNFPYSFDRSILKTKPILKNNGYKMYQLEGYMMGGVKRVGEETIQTWKRGVYEIGMTKEGIINHRFFRPY